MAFLHTRWQPSQGSPPVTYAVRIRPTPVIAPPPPQSTLIESPHGATATSVNDPAIVDSNLDSWTLVSSATQGLQIARNKTVDATTNSVTLLLYWNHVFWQENSRIEWYYWSNGAWLVGTDPRLSIPNPPDTSQIQTYVANLVRPWAMAQLTDGTLLVTQRDSFNLTHITSDGVHHDMLISGTVTTNGDGGLMGVAVDPQYAINNYIYITHTTSSNNQVVRYSFNQTTHVLANATTLLTWSSATYGNGGTCKFGPDGYLYVCCGYAGSSTNPQSLTSNNGKICRIKTDGTIPSDNPIANSAIWSLGHRVPSGMCWIGSTMYAVEIGPDGETIGGTAIYGYDKLNQIVKNGNYGYPLAYGTNTVIDARGNRTLVPLLTSGSTEIWTPSGLTAVASTLYFGAMAGLNG